MVAKSIKNLDEYLPGIGIMFRMGLNKYTYLSMNSRVTKKQNRINKAVMSMEMSS
jgi:hypothetical protein